MLNAEATVGWLFHWNGFLWLFGAFWKRLLKNGTLIYIYHIYIYTYVHMYICTYVHIVIASCDISLFAD